MAACLRTAPGGAGRISRTLRSRIKRHPLSYGRAVFVPEVAISAGGFLQAGEKTRLFVGWIDTLPPCEAFHTLPRR